jgi:hypothetical protein
MNHEEKSLVVNTCFTTKAGIVQSYYRKVTRQKVKVVMKMNKQGKEVPEREKVRVHGLEPPNLHYGDEYLRDDEKSALKELSRVFPQETRVVETFLRDSEEITYLTPAKVAKVVVEKAYAISDKISRVLRTRKEKIRSICARTSDKKIPQAEWIAKRDSVLGESVPLDEIFLDSIRNFAAETTLELLGMTQEFI